MEQRWVESASRRGGCLKANTNIPCTYANDINTENCVSVCERVRALTEGEVISGGVDMSPKSSNWWIFCSKERKDE